MNSLKAVFGYWTGLAALTVLLILAGGSLNGSGRFGWPTALAVLAGLLALASGATRRSWRVAAPAAIAALSLDIVLAQFNPQQGDLLLQLAGLAVLGAAGVAGETCYREVTGTLGRQARELEQKSRAFLAATTEVETAPGDLGVLTTNIAHQLGADVACCYLASSDQRQFVPQAPGVGLEGLGQPRPVMRHQNGSSQLLAAIEAGRAYSGVGAGSLAELFNYLADDVRLRAAMAVPMPIGDRLGGFVVLARRSTPFTEDDRRLATTLTLRAGAVLASAHAVALSQKESARYSLINELVKEASGRPMQEVLELVVARGKEVVHYDAGRAIVFQPDEELDEPLQRVRAGQTVLRNAVTEEQHTFSGLRLQTHAVTVNEALTPIRGKEGVIGALCLGRRGTTSFTQNDIAALDELGSMAGVAVENSRILQVVTGQASRLDTALDALGEVSAALTTVTEGSRVLEQKTLEAAIRVVDGSAGLLTRANEQGHQTAILSVGFAEPLDGMVFQNGQGIVGATMLSQRATAVSDVTGQQVLSSPPDLAAAGVHAAICTPMLEDGRLWGTLTVFDRKKREWAADDQRVLSTLGNQGVVAVRNAELYEKNERSIWELRNLQEALQAATSTLDLNQVLQQVLAGAAKASSAQIGCLALEDRGRLVLKGGFGTDHVTAERLALGLGGEICKQVMESGSPVMEAMTTQTSGDGALNPRAVLCVPIRLRGKPLGVVFLANYKAGLAFTRDHRELVTELAAQAAVAIDNARLFKDREEVILA